MFSTKLYYIAIVHFVLGPLEHSGYSFIESFEWVFGPVYNEGAGQEQEINTRQYFRKIELRPEYSIVRIQPDSPAERGGLKTGDVIGSINGKKGHKFRLEEIISLFSSQEGKNIKLKVFREGKELEFKFRLEKVL